MRILWLPVALVILLGLWLWLEQPVTPADGRTVIRWVINSQDRDVQYAEAVRAGFERRHPDIHVEFIKTNEGRKVETMIAGGDAPDILVYGLDRAHYYLSAGVLRDLTPLMSLQDRQALADYFPLTLAPFQRGESLYALPWGYVPFILFYNKGLFDRFGVPYPDDGWTWDDYRRAARALTHDLDGDGVTDIFGASFAQWQEGYYCWIFQNGGRVLSSDGQEAAFDSPRVVQAVAFLHELTRRDRVMPTEVNRPRATGIGLFESGRLAMNGPTGSFYIPTYRTYEGVDWDIAAVPAGPGGRGTMVSPQGIGVTTGSRHPEQAYRFLRFLCGEEGQAILGDCGLFVPCLREAALSPRFLKGPGAPRNKYALVAMMDDRDGRKPWGIAPPWSGSRWGDVNDEALNPALEQYLFGVPRPGQTALSVCTSIDRRADEILGEGRRAGGGRPVDWTFLTAATGAAAAAGGFAWVVGVRRRIRGSRRESAEAAAGYLAIAPWLAGFLLLSAGPILFSLLLSFTRWSSLAPADTARFVGLQHYATLLSGQDELFLRSLKATALYSLLHVPIHLAGGLTLALAMNARVRGIALYRTLYYLPAVMPAVASAVVFRWLLGQDGLVNLGLALASNQTPRDLPNWLGDPFWTIPGIVLAGLWGIGGGMMIYLAGLQNIPTQLYEAARIDGAGVWAQFRTVTLPLLSPVIFFNLVMSVIGSFQVFTSVFVLFGGGAGPEDSALFYSFYLYRKAFEQFQVGYASALAWILFALILGLTLLIFRSSPFWVHYEAGGEGGR